MRALLVLGLLTCTGCGPPPLEAQACSPSGVYIMAAERTLCSLALQSDHVLDLRITGKTWGTRSVRGVDSPVTIVQYEVRRALRGGADVSPLVVYGGYSCGPSTAGDIGDVDTQVDGIAFISPDVSGTGFTLITGGFLALGPDGRYGNEFLAARPTFDEVGAYAGVLSSQDCPGRPAVGVESTLDSPL